MFLEAIREGVCEPDILRRALHYLKPFPLVTRRLRYPVHDSRHPQDHVHDRVGVEQQHAPDFALDNLAVAPFSSVQASRTRSGQW